MAAPRFSVVIPTRERAHTLRYSLKTCLEQDFSDYEIVVCDNFGSPATRQVVEEYASPKIRYIRAPQLLSMTANWELAVSHAQGEYVLVLGDDDGLLFHALREIDKLITQTQAKAVRWTAAYYTWPDFALPGQGNYLRIPIKTGRSTMNAREAFAQVIAFQACYTSLPMLYNAAVHRDIIAELRNRTGCVFANCYPDVYTGFAVAWIAQKYLSLQTPMTIAGSSGKSYGIANLFLRGKSPLDKEFRESNRKEKLRSHRWVPDLALFPAAPVADSFLVAKELLFPEDELTLDRRILVTHCMGALRAEDEASWKQAIEIIRATLDDDPETQAWFDENFRVRLFPGSTKVQLRSSYLGMDGEYLHLSADQFRVEDVHAAAQVCENVLNYGSSGIKFLDLDAHLSVDRQSAQPGITHQEIAAQLHLVARERLEAICQLEEHAKSLAGVAADRLVQINVLKAELEKFRDKTFSRRVYSLCRRMANFLPSRVRRLVRGAGAGQQN